MFFPRLELHHIPEERLSFFKGSYHPKGKLVTALANDIHAFAVLGP